MQVMKINFKALLGSMILVSMLLGCATQTGVPSRESTSNTNAHPYGAVYRVTAFEYIGEKAPSKIQGVFEAAAVVAFVVTQFDAASLNVLEGASRIVNTQIVSDVGLGAASLITTKKGTYRVSYTSASGLAHNIRSIGFSYTGLIVVDKDPVTVLEVGDYIVIEDLARNKSSYKADKNYVRIDKVKEFNKKIPKHEISRYTAHQNAINKAREYFSKVN